MELPPNLKPDEASPEWMNKGDNAWQLTAATLVGLQCVPGLVILYGAMVKKKWAINSGYFQINLINVVFLHFINAKVSIYLLSIKFCHPRNYSVSFMLYLI